MSKRRIELVYEETLKYMKTATIETDMSDSEIEKTLDSTERFEDLMNVEVSFENKKAKMIKRFDSDYSSPINIDLEAVEYFEVKEKELKK